jgi:hypothetical protein
VDRLHAELIARPSRLAPAFCLVFVALVSASACSPPVLAEPTFESDTALAQAVLDRVARHDAQGLLALSVTKDEFEDLVWPELPASRPGVNLPVSYVWRNSYFKSRSYLSQTLDEYGGRRFELKKVAFAGEETDYGTYNVSRKTVLVVEDPQGREQRIRLFGSIIRQNGRSKIYSYIVD